MQMHIAIGFFIFSPLCLLHDKLRQIMLSVAWLIGWALILEYTIGGSSVARGMSPNLVMLSIKLSLHRSDLFITRSSVTFFQALFFGGQDKLPFFLAQVHVNGLDTPLDPCAAILVMIVTALLCLGIKEVLLY